MKPSLARWDKWTKMQEGNALIENYIDSKPNLHFLDISEPILLENGEPDPAIFIEDGLHMNLTGYQRWTALIKPFLEKLLEENSLK